MRLEKVIKLAIAESIEDLDLYEDTSIEAKARRLLECWKDASYTLGTRRNLAPDVIFKSPELFKEFAKQYYKDPKIGLTLKELNTACIVIENWGYFNMNSIRVTRSHLVWDPQGTPQTYLR